MQLYRTVVFPPLGCLATLGDVLAALPWLRPFVCRRVRDAGPGSALSDRGPAVERTPAQHGTTRHRAL